MKTYKKFWLVLILSLVTTVIFAVPKSLTFATEATYPPFESMNKNGQMQGFDIDIINAVCAQMQTTCKFVNQPWDSLIPGLELGKFDVIFGAMMITPERQKQVDFTDPYFKNTGIFVAAKSSNLSLENLKGKTIGLQTATPFDDYVRSVYGKQISVNRYNSIQDALLDLQSGRVDAVFADSALLLAWLKEPANQAYTQIGKSIDDPQYFGKGNGLAVKKGNRELVQALNQGLATIKANGTYQKIQRTYFGDHP